MKGDPHDQLRPLPPRSPVRLLRPRRGGGGAHSAHRPDRLHPQLPAGDGVRGEVDVLGGRRAGQALAGHPGQPDERPGVPGHRGKGPLEADGLHPAHGQRRRPHGEGAESGPGGAVPGKPVHIFRFCGLLLRDRLSGGTV